MLHQDAVAPGCVVDRHGVTQGVTGPWDALCCGRFAVIVDADDGEVGAGAFVDCDDTVCKRLLRIAQSEILCFPVVAKALRVGQHLGEAWQHLAIKRRALLGIG